MSDQPTKKPAAKRPSRAKKAAEPKPAPVEMDPSVTETPVPVSDDGTQDPSLHAPFSARNCWAMETLLAEVKALYPEVLHMTTDMTGRQVGTTVEFIDWDSHEGVEPSLPDVLACIEPDHRVASVERNAADGQGEETVSVVFHQNPVTMDLRDPFSLADAYAILSDSEGSGE